MHNFGVDWLSIYCKGVVNCSAPWHLQRQEYSTKQYKYVDFLFFNNDQFATITHTPHSKILDQSGMIIKLENRYLYSQRYVFILSKFLQEANINFCGISRLDLFTDFQEFEDGTKPPDFIEKVFKLEILKNGRSKFATQGATAQKISYEYLKFGTRAANSLTYLYNKTKELEEVKEKEYIRETWKLAGFKELEPVWRLEYSFKPSKHGILDTDAGDYSHLTLSDLTNIKLLKQIYSTAIAQYFAFKVNTGIKNKSEMPDYNLLPLDSTNFKLAYIPEVADNIQQAKRLINSLMQQYYECNDDYQILKNSIIDSVHGIASKYSISDFIRKKYKLIRAAV